ncbi:MAG: response regulator [Nitrospinaceae bacterium]
MSKDSRILVVEDNTTTRLYIKRILRNLGYSAVKTTDDGAAALVEMRMNSYDLIISDWNMPNLNGLEFLKTLKKTPRFSSIPFLMITGENQLLYVKKALRHGASNYIVKPFEADGFKQKIQELLN